MGSISTPDKWATGSFMFRARPFEFVIAVLIVPKETEGALGAEVLRAVRETPDLRKRFIGSSLVEYLRDKKPPMCGFQAATSLWVEDRFSMFLVFRSDASMATFTHELTHVQEVMTDLDLLDTPSFERSETLAYIMQRIMERIEEGLEKLAVKATK